MTSSLPFITVVSGLPRSGTSLMMQMLQAGGVPLLADGIRAADESNPRGYYEYEPVKRTRADVSWVHDAVGKAVKVIYALLPDLPEGFEYRVILMRRNPAEIVASQAAMLRVSGQEGSTLPEDTLAEVLQSDLDRVIASLAARSGFYIHEVLHGDCLKNPMVVAEALNGFLGACLDTPAMAQVPDLGLYRTRA